MLQGPSVETPIGRAQTEEDIEQPLMSRNRAEDSVHNADLRGP